MSTTVERRPRLNKNGPTADIESPREVMSRLRPGRADEKALLFAGIAAVALYIIGDLVSGLLYGGYSFRDQAISELAAFGSPVRPLMVTVILLHNLLLVAFGVGVWRAAGRKSLRWAGLSLIAIGVTGVPTHTVFAMSSRWMEGGFNDTMHVAFTAAFTLFVVVAIVLSAIAYPGWFRRFSIGMLVLLTGFGAAAGVAIQGIEENATAWAGGFERINAYAYFAWLIALTVILLRTRTIQAKKSMPLVATKTLDRDIDAEWGRITVRKALLACGVLYALLYPMVNDAIAATIYDGYSRMDQAVSELSATGAPTHAFLTAVGPVFSLLLIGFGLGIRRSARGKRSFRIAGALVVAHGAMSFLWVFGPMSQREVIAAGGATSADTIHLLLSAATGVFVAAYVSTTAFAFGWAFRLYSLVTIASALTFGLLSAQVGRIEAGDPTPYMGLLERIGMGAWLLWIAVLAVILLRRPAMTGDPHQTQALSLGEFKQQKGVEDGTRQPVPSR